MSTPAESNVALPAGNPPKRWSNRTVNGAGVTGALDDFCYETTTVMLPVCLAVLGIPAAVLGIIEGIADAVASFTKMVSATSPTNLGIENCWLLWATA